MTDSTPNPTQARRGETAGGAERLSVDAANELARAVIENVETVIVGKHDAVEHILTAVLGRGHILLEDVPGVGKTMLARAFARSVDAEFSRVQFTPDLLPSDVTGVNVYNQGSNEFEFQSGPVFGNVVLGDEINRAPPKTQSALLEAMEEGQVTVDGETHPLPDPFVVIATQNAVERDRTYELPLAEVDRFIKKIELGYPDAESEREVLRRVVGDHPIEAVEPVATVEEIRGARAAAAAVSVEAPVRAYVTELAAYTRQHAALGVSTRGIVRLLRAAQGRAVLDARDYVIPDDVKREAPVVLPHRIRAQQGGAVGGEAAETVVEDALERVTPE
jgi:MoxR-like ATPase